jgi:hypothetical protein
MATSGVNPAGYFSIHKASNLPNTRATALYTEAQDNVGWIGSGANNFVEGLRSQATIMNSARLSSAYGAVIVGGEAAGATHNFLVGVEAEIDNRSTDATTNFNPNKFAGSFVASSGGSKEADCAFCVNPYLGPGVSSAAAAFQTGFFVPAGSGSISTPVTDSAFRSDALTAWGINLNHVPAGSSTFTALGVPNNTTIIRARNAADKVNMNLLEIDGSDNELVGADPRLGRVDLGSSAVPVRAVGPLVASHQHTPASTTESCEKGTITYDTSGYLYVCYAANTWGRTRLTPW